MSGLRTSASGIAMQQDFQLSPSSFDPEDDAIVQLEAPSGQPQPVTFRERGQRLGAALGTVQPQFPPVHPLPGRVLVGLPQITQDRSSDGRDVRHQGPVFGPSVPGVLGQEVLEQCEEPLPVGVGDPHDRALGVVLGRGMHRE
jgi:hypothetical protein